MLVYPVGVNSDREVPDVHNPGADPGFQVRGWGGALKIIASSGARHEHFWGILCEKSRFYIKKSYFFPPTGSAPAI